jgi:hypothetical protein
VLKNLKQYITLSARRGAYLVLVCLLLTSVTWAGYLMASETSERRVKISLSIFPRVIAVDNHFRDKLTSNHKAHLVFVYDKDRDKSEELREIFLQKNNSVAGMKLEVESVNVRDLVVTGMHSPTALFVTERLADEELAELVAYAISKHIILFSPFAGDVERGATAGIAVTSRVKPYFNVNTLKQSEIEINALLMKLSKRYE